MKREKIFEIKGTFEITINIFAKDRKEAKAFAEEEFANFVGVDTNELNGVLVNSIRQTKKPKVKRQEKIEEEYVQVKQGQEQ
jgi:hypothetical protein